jgi:hypothetical protein
LWLAGERSGREISVEIIALNLEQGLQKPHVIRILPGEEFQLQLESLGDTYGTLHLFSMSPYVACIIDLASGEKQWVDRLDSIYRPPDNVADQLNRPLYDPSPPPIYPPPISIGGGSSDGHLYCNLTPTWTLVCATPSLCGDYTRTGYGTVWLTNPQDPYYLHYFQITWGVYHYSCGNLATQTRNTADPDYPDCVTNWILTYGNCPVTATNCRGEMYTVYRSL